MPRNSAIVSRSNINQTLFLQQSEKRQNKKTISDDTLAALQRNTVQIVNQQIAISDDEKMAALTELLTTFRQQSMMDILKEFYEKFKLANHNIQECLTKFQTVVSPSQNYLEYLLFVKEMDIIYMDCKNIFAQYENETVNIKKLATAINSYWLTHGMKAALNSNREALLNNLNTCLMHLGHKIHTGNVQCFTKTFHSEVSTVLKKIQSYASEENRNTRVLITQITRLNNCLFDELLLHSQIVEPINTQTFYMDFIEKTAKEHLNAISNILYDLKIQIAHYHAEKDNFEELIQNLKDAAQPGLADWLENILGPFVNSMKQTLADYIVEPAATEENVETTPNSLSLAEMKQELESVEKDLLTVQQVEQTESLGDSLSKLKLQ